jgi:hypothetical protein
MIPSSPMKRLCALLLIGIAPSAFAGLTYRSESVSTGMRNMTISGAVAVEGSRLRMDIIKGDNMMFKDNAVVLSEDGGRTLSVFDPASKSYYELHLEDLLSNTSSMLKGFGDMIKLTFDNPKVSVRDEGDGGAIEGYPTRKYVLDASYDMNVDAMGQKMTTHMTMNTETWATEQLSAQASNFLQIRGLRTGIDSIDKVIEAQSGSVKGFPLKQVSTVTINQNGTPLVITTTTNVKDVVKKDIEPARFAAPAGYTKVDDPVTKMMKAMKQ